MEVVGNLLWRQASPQQTDKTSCYYPICLPTQIVHEEPSWELRRSLHPVALACAAGGEMTAAKEDRREPQKWVSREVRRPPGTLAAWMRERLHANALALSSRRGTHVAAVPLHVAFYPVGSLQKESRGRWNVNHARLRVDGRLLAPRHAADPAHLMRPRVGLAHLRVRAHAWEGVHFAGLGDNYSRDRLFPGTRYGDKRSREMEGASELRRGRHSRQTASD